MFSFSYLVILVSSLVFFLIKKTKQYPKQNAMTLPKVTWLQQILKVWHHPILC